MLILSRRVGQTLVIGGNVTVTILRAHGKQVRVGISAPQSIEVHRGEIFERIENERRKHPAAELG
jgi:carbon storage regulator